MIEEEPPIEPPEEEPEEEPNMMYLYVTLGLFAVIILGWLVSLFL